MVFRRAVSLSILLVLLLGMGHVDSSRAEEKIVTIGSKKFTESVILGEIAGQRLRSEGFEYAHRQDLGGTRVLWNALVSGDIDIYPEYTGTLMFEIFAGSSIADMTELELKLAEVGIRMTQPLGFNNTYAIGMKEELAEELGVQKVSDLARFQDLSFGFTNEFMDRSDGWPGLRDHYGLSPKKVRGLDHDLAYRGLQSGTLHVMDIYSTDAEIEYYNLRVIEDDRRYFPEYHAVFLYRAELAQNEPSAVRALKGFEGKILEKEMIAMNARAKLDHVPEMQVAADFLYQTFNVARTVQVESKIERLWRYTREHLLLVLISLTSAILISIPLGILSERRPRLGQVILGVAGVIQTIPSLALLVFMIPLLGIGNPPAVVALFLYSLLPIIRNTYTGLHNIPRDIRESAEALGLPPSARLWKVELPLAARTILAGVKTSAVINVGTATLGALIGAGGYGQPILTGIRLDDVGLILQGAIPAALLALLVQGIFEWGERILVPRGLRLRREV